MNIKKLGASVAAGTLLTLGLAVVPALGASAHTFSTAATCEDGLTVNLSNYHPTIPGEDAVPGTPAIPGAHHDAVGSPTITVDNPDYVPAVDAVATTYVQEFEYVQKITGHISWHEEGWNPGKGWNATGNHRDSSTVLVQGHDAVPAQGTPTIEVTNPDYVAAYDDPETPGTPGKDAVPEQHNHVTATIDGTELVSSDFGPAFHENYPNPDKTVGHTYTVTVTSLDGIGAFSKTLEVPACETPAPGAANPAATIQADCGTADILLTNDGENLLTASFVVYVDGDFYGAYAVQAGDHQNVSLAFEEDSGEHTVEVRTGPAQGDDLLAKAIVKSDCKPAVVTPPSDNPTPPATPVAPAAPAAPAAPVAATQALQTQDVAEDTLAQTGSDVTPWVAGGLLLLVVGAGLFGVTARRTPKPRYRRTQA